MFVHLLNIFSSLLQISCLVFRNSIRLEISLITSWDTHPSVHSQHPVMKELHLIVVVEYNSKISMTLFHFFHNASINNKLIDRTQYSLHCSSLVFLPGLILHHMFPHMLCYQPSHGFV